MYRHFVVLKIINNIIYIGTRGEEVIVIDLKNWNHKRVTFGKNIFLTKNKIQ